LNTEPSVLPEKTAISIELPKPTTVVEVETHNCAVRRRSADRACYRTSCARCGKLAPFAPHQLRPRGLRLIVDHTVLCVTVWLARWRCRHCRHVFTDYPDFRTPVQTLRRPHVTLSGRRLRREGPAVLSANGQSPWTSHRLRDTARCSSH